MLNSSTTCVLQSNTAITKKVGGASVHTTNGGAVY